MALFDILNVNPAQNVQPYSVDPTLSQQGLLGMFAQLGQVAARGIAQAAGRDLRSPQQRLTEALKNTQINERDPQSLINFAQRLDSLGLSEQSFIVRQQASALIQNQEVMKKTRESLLTRASNAGLTYLSEQINNANTPEQLEDISNNLAEVERDRALQQMNIGESRSARAAILRATGLPITEESLSLSPDAFEAMIQGESAELVQYIRTLPNGREEPALLRTNDAGLVFLDNPTGFGKWVQPSSLNLVAAPETVIQEVRSGTGYELDDTDLEVLQERYDTANSALLEYNTYGRGLDILEMDEAPYTGVFGEMATFIGRLGTSLGISGANQQERTDNTLLFIKNQMTNVATEIKNFGSGTGLSDADREFAIGLSGADPASMTKSSLARFLKIRQQLALEKISRYQDIYESALDARNFTPVRQELYRVPMPEARVSPKENIIESIISSNPSYRQQDLFELTMEELNTLLTLESQ